MDPYNYGVFCIHSKNTKKIDHGKYIPRSNGLSDGLSLISPWKTRLVHFFGYHFQRSPTKPYQVHSDDSMEFTVLTSKPIEKIIKKSRDFLGHEKFRPPYNGEKSPIFLSHEKPIESHEKVETPIPMTDPYVW